MDHRPDFVQQYFEKATALVLASAGIETVEKQALHLLASEARRYATSLSAHASSLAEAARRTECTAADIEAAAKCIDKDRSTIIETSSKFTVSSELKKKLRLSVEIGPAIEKSVSSNIQFLQPSIDNTSSPSKPSTKRLTAYPEWLQTAIETKHLETGPRHTPLRHSAEHKHAHATKGTDGPLSFISALAMAEEESRDILTKRLKTEVEAKDLSRDSNGPNS